MAGPVVTPTWPGYRGICCSITPGAWAATALQGEGVGLVTGVPGTASVRATE